MSATMSLTTSSRTVGVVCPTWGCVREAITRRTQFDQHKGQGTDPTVRQLEITVVG